MPPTSVFTQLNDIDRSSEQEVRLPFAGLDPYNERMNDSVDHAAARRNFRYGAAYALAAALCYTLCNTCLRAATGYDPYFVCVMRAIPTILLLAPIVVTRPLRNLPMLPPWPAILVLVVAGIGSHVGGNGLFQFALRSIGMAPAVPLSHGTMIIAGAFFGRMLLHEPLTPRMTLGSAIIVASLFLLSTAKAAPAIDSASAGVNGVLAAVSAGVFFASIGAAIRYCGRYSLTIPQTLTIASGAGLAVLMVICYARLGFAGIAAIPARAVLTMFAAGAFNAAAFMALARSLQLTSLVFVQAVNSTQTAMAAAAAIVLFDEPFTWQLAVGIVLIVIGLLCMHNAPRAAPSAGAA